VTGVVTVHISLDARRNVTAQREQQYNEIQNKFLGEYSKLDRV